MDERVEDVDGRHDPCRERDFLPGKAARIAAAVEAFVVAASDLGAVGEVALAADQGGGLFEDELAVAGCSFMTSRSSGVCLPGLSRM